MPFSVVFRLRRGGWRRHVTWIPPRTFKAELQLGPRIKREWRCDRSTMCIAFIVIRACDEMH